MRSNAYPFRPVVAVALAVLVALVAAQPALAAPRLQRQWYLDFLRINAVHKISTGQGVLVGVVDSGVDAGHPDLAGQVVPGARVDGRSGDGRVDEDGHGTHMAGIIAARNRGRDGVLGVAPGAKILPITVATMTDEDVSPIAVADGIRAAVDRGAKVVNVSMAGFGSGQEMEAVKYALSKDVVVVAGAGNIAKGHRAVMSPANIPGVIGVTGLNQRGSFWSGSVQGAEAVVSAPAEEILNVASRAEYRSGYSIGDGTSDATAMVSAVAALIRAKYPNLDAANVINRIIRTADDAGPAGRDPQYGFGKIDALEALTAKVPTVTANPLTGAAATPTARAGGDKDEPFDVTKYGDRGGPTDQQVMIIAIGLAVLLVLVLILAIWLLVRWRRRRAASGHGPAVPGGYDAAPPAGYGGAPTGYGPPPTGHGAPGSPHPGGPPASYGGPSVDPPVGPPR